MHDREAASIWERLGGLEVRRVVVVEQLAPWWDGLGVHRHPIPTLVAPVQGAVRIELGPHRVLDLAVGEAALIRPWVWHGQPRPWGGSAIGLGWSHRQGDVSIYRQDSWWDGQVPRPVIEQRLAGLADAPGGELPGLSTRLMQAIAAHRPAALPMSQPLRRMCEAIWFRRTRPITAAQVLGASGLSYAAAHILFTGYFGEAPKRLLLRLRLDLARRLLSDGRPVGRIWAECGFTSRAAFTRRFRLVHGTPPSSWRAAQRAQGRQR